MLNLDDFLPYRLNVLAKRISRELSSRYADRFGIGISEWRVLAILGREQPLSSNDIVDRTQMDKAKVSRAVARMVDTGLLARQTHPEDQRLLQLSLTALGQELYDRIAPVALEWESQLLVALSSEERILLSMVIDRLNARLSEMAEDSVASAINQTR